MGNYKLYRKKNYPDFGLTFHSEDSIPLVDVESGSPAEYAGMHSLQCIIAINGKLFTKDLKTVADVLKYIKHCYFNSREHVEVTAIGLDQWDEFVESLKPRSKESPSSPSISSSKAHFKRCFVHFIRDFEGFGFVLNSKVKPKYSIVEIDSSSPAFKANLRADDVIIELNGLNIRHMEFAKVKELLNDSYEKGQVEILAVSKDHYTYYKNKKKNFSNSQFISAAKTRTYQVKESTALSSLALSAPEEAPISSEEANRLKVENQQLQEKLMGLKIRSDCVICLETLSEQSSVTPCGHLFCTKCLTETFASSYEILCPTCRKAIVFEYCYSVYF